MILNDMIPTNVRISKREKEILYLLSESYTSMEIANMLYLSKRTVDFHRANLMVKLGAKNAAMLIKKAIEYGLL